MSKTKNRWLALGANVARGALIGSADIVPGVSGGTVALVLGIYERLVTAISRFDLDLLGHLRRGRWRAAADHIDLGFLATLIAGVAIGFLAMTLAMHRLLTDERTRPLALAAFFGVIFASAILVAAQVRVRRGIQVARSIALGCLGAAAAFLLVVLPGQQIDPSPAFLFLCGAIAICAMILPGISGAMILLLLGVYEFLTGIPRQLIEGQNVGPGLLSVLCFAAGCAVGLLAFSKLLKRLLANYRSATMALMCGFMFGALPRLWPFQSAAAFEKKIFEPVWPAAFDMHVVEVILVAATAAAVVLAGQWLARYFPAPEVAGPPSLQREKAPG